MTRASAGVRYRKLHVHRAVAMLCFALSGRAKFYKAVKGLGFLLCRVSYYCPRAGCAERGSRSLRASIGTPVINRLHLAAYQ